MLFFMSRSTVTSSCSSSCCAPHSSSPLFTSLSLSCSCAADLCLLAQETWRSSSRCACVLSRSRAAPKCRAGWPCPWPWPHEAVGKIAVPGGPYQYYVVHQYSAVRRAWGPGGVAIFLNRSAYTPLRSLMGVLLTTPVRCTIGMRLHRGRDGYDYSFTGYAGLQV